MSAVCPRLLVKSIICATFAPEISKLEDINQENLNKQTMNLRVIKKDIEYFVGEFIDDCTLFAALNPDKNNEDLAKIIDEAVDLYNNLKDKVNHPAKDVKPSVYYKGITKELFESLDALCEKLSSVVSAK